MVARTLITTAIEQTWPYDKKEPVIFLGDWCCKYTRKSVWEKMDAEIVSYHWDDRTKLLKDYKYLQELYETLLLEITNKMNEIHNTNHDLRYWRIFIGPWLGYFVQMLFDRWFMLKYTIENYNISKVFVLKRENALVPNDMTSFIDLFINDDWNEYIYTQLLKKFWKNSFDIVEVDQFHQNPVISKQSFNFKKKIKFFLYYFTRTIGFFNSTKDDYFFIGTNLPLKIESKLQAKLGQIPKFWETISIPKNAIQAEKRDWKLDYKKKLKDQFFSIACNLIPLNVPIAYLEGYNSLLQIPKKNKWPNSPKVIFTSYSYTDDDVTKLYTAENTEKGTKLIINQHGGHIGTSPFAYHEEHQIMISDIWLSWGWKDKNRQNIWSFGNIRTSGRNVSYDPEGNALMVQATFPRYSYHILASIISSQWLCYFEDQINFLKALPSGLQKRINVRLYPHDYGFGQIERWTETGLNVKLEIGNMDIISSLKKSRLCISTYNSTTFLETLSWNIPTIMFWNPDHWELNTQAKIFFNKLIKVGILHYSPESAAKHLINIWDNVDSWWLSDNVQSVKNQFCKYFSLEVKQPVYKLSKIIRMLK